jgi:hypothetical protein
VRFRFTRPSPRRVLWSILAVVAVCCVIAGIALSIGFIRGASGPAPTGDYIRLVILCITFWGPVFLLTIWQITIPAIDRTRHACRVRSSQPSSGHKTSERYCDQ